MVQWLKLPGNQASGTDGSETKDGVSRLIATLDGDNWCRLAEEQCIAGEVTHSIQDPKANGEHR